MTLADLLDKLERGRIGHREAMQRLGVDRYNKLVDIMHANGRRMPGHRATPVSAETRNVLRLAIKPRLRSVQVSKSFCAAFFKKRLLTYSLYALNTTVFDPLRITRSSRW